MRKTVLIVNFLFLVASFSLLIQPSSAEDITVEELINKHFNMRDKVRTWKATNDEIHKSHYTKKGYGSKEYVVLDLDNKTA